MSRLRYERFHVVIGFPRVSGDEPPVRFFTAGIPAFSPRERG